MEHLVIFSDPGKDQDDEVMLILLASFLKTKKIKSANIIASLAPALTRARLAKGTLRELGLEVPVISGDSILNNQNTDHQLECISYLAPASSILLQSKLLIDTLKKAASKSVGILVVSGMTDLAKLLSTNRDLLKEKVSKVVLMSGVQTELNGSPVRDKNDFLLPDSSANNEFDLCSAKTCFEVFQKMEMPFSVLTRYAAYDCKIDIEFFEKMAATNNKIGLQLLISLKYRLEALWYQANLPIESLERQGLPERCDRNWFISTFCDGIGLTSTASDFKNIWHHVKWLNLYDPLALVATVDYVAKKFFVPQIFSVGNTHYEVIGLSPSQTGIKDPEKLKSYIEKLVLEQLRSVEKHED